MSKKITAEAWSRVHEKALNIVNASRRDDFLMVDVFTEQMLELLTELDETFGPSPILMATRADYLQDKLERKNLYEAALSLARSQGDNDEVLEISDSLQSL